MTLWLLLAVLAVAVVAWMRRGGRVALGRGGSQPQKTARCRWTATGEGYGRLQQYRCATCGETAYSGTGKAPSQCRKAIGGDAL